MNALKLGVTARRAVLVCVGAAMTLTVPACFSSSGDPVDMEDDAGSDDAADAGTDPTAGGITTAGATSTSTSGDATTGVDPTTGSADTGLGETGVADTGMAETGAGTDGTGGVVPKRVFVTSNVVVALAVPGSFSICQGLADAAGLDGTFMPWITFGNFEPATDFNTADVPYVLVDGTPVADDWDDLIDGDLLSPINRNEDGTLVTSAIQVWTNTRADGTGISLAATPANCTMFSTNSPIQTARVGHLNDATDSWTDAAGHPCPGAARFYCFEQ